MNRKHVASCAPPATIGRLCEEFGRTIKIYPGAIHQDISNLVSDASLLPGATRCKRFADGNILPHKPANRPIDLASPTSEG